MKTLAAVAIVGACAVGLQAGGPGTTAHDAAVETYEHLATAIIANGRAEEGLVRGILIHNFTMARRQLGAAVGAPAGDRATLLEEAATQITNVANEGDKPVQAIRQRLLKAGHHHHTDAETDDDYIFVDGREKKALLDLARDVSRMSRDASDDQVRDALRRLTALRDEVLAPE